MANYEQTFGRAPDIAQLQDLGIFQAGLPASLPEALNLGLNQSPRLKLSAMQISKAGDQILAARAGGGPVVDLVGARNYDRGANATAKRDDYSMLLRLNWSFSAGNENDHRVSAALKDKDELMERDVAQRNKVREAIRVSWNQLVNGRERLELLDSAAGIARDVMLNRKRLRDAGKETALSALDAEVEYFGVLANKINAMYDTRIGAYRLMAAVGGLTPEAVGLGNGFKLPVQPLKVDLQAIAGQGLH
jgi:outer membrane protein TolC